MDYKRIKEYKRIKKNDVKKWLLGGNAKIYGLILIVFLAAVLFMFKTVNTMFTTAPVPETELPVETEEESTTAYFEENQSYLIKVNKTNNFITIYKRSSTGEFDQAYRAFRCSVSADAKIGDSIVTDKNIWKKLSDGSSYGHYATRLDNAGTITSVPYYAQDNSRMNVTAYNNLGKTAKIGYIYLAASDAQWIYENCGIDTKVMVYEDADESPAFVLEELETVPSGKTYDPSDTNTPTNDKVSSTKVDFMRGVNDCSIPLNTPFDQWEGIYAQDMNRNDITSKITITGTVDVSVPGTYTLIYHLSDNFGTNLAYYRYVTVTEE